MKTLSTITVVCLCFLVSSSWQSAVGKSGDKQTTSAVNPNPTPRPIVTGAPFRPEIPKDQLSTPSGSRGGGEDFATATFFYDTEFYPGGTWTDSGTTIGFADDYDAACGGGTSTSPDAVYLLAFSSGDLSHIDIELCDAGYDTKMMVYEFSTGELIACSEDYCGIDGYRSEVLNLDVTAYGIFGFGIFIVVDGWGGESGNYVLNISEADSCDWSAPGGATVEGETCGVRENDGCNMVTPAYTDVTDGEVVWAKTWADTNSRDTDWYRLTVSSSDSVMMIFSAPSTNQLVYGLAPTNTPGSGNCADLVGSLNPNKVFASACAVDTLRMFLPSAGTYFLFAARSEYWGIPCVDPLFGYSRELNYWVKFDVCNNTWYFDGDGDGYGDPNISSNACEQPSGYVADSTDCDDSEPDYHELQHWCADNDGDGWGDENEAGFMCVPPAGYLLLCGLGVDCNDNDPEVTSTSWYFDSDTDGYGSGFADFSCTNPAPGFTVSNNLDCDDNDPDIGPPATWYEDQDGDGWGDAGTDSTNCAQPSGYVATTPDNCPTVSNPGQQDTNNDGIGDACCCIGNRGDVNFDGVNANILDLNFTVNRIFRGGPPAACPKEGDCNSDGTSTNILDLNFLVNRIFRGGSLPGPCL